MEIPICKPLNALFESACAGVAQALASRWEDAAVVNVAENDADRVYGVAHHAQ